MMMQRLVSWSAFHCLDFSIAYLQKKQAKKPNSTSKKSKDEDSDAEEVGLLCALRLVVIRAV